MKLQQERIRALSVWNPWAWALVTARPNGRPLKPGENRVTPLWTTMIDKWVLIQVGLHKPDLDQVEAVRQIAEREGVVMPSWASAPSLLTQNGRKIGAIVGAVRFVKDCDPDDVQDHGGYAGQWVSDDATHWWAVGECVAFDRHLPCKGQQAPLFFDVRDQDVHAQALEELRRLVP